MVLVVCLFKWAGYVQVFQNQARRVRSCHWSAFLSHIFTLPAGGDARRSSASWRCKALRRRLCAAGVHSPRRAANARHGCACILAALQVSSQLQLLDVVERAGRVATWWCTGVTACEIACGADISSSHFQNLLSGSAYIPGHRAVCQPPAAAAGASDRQGNG